MPAWAAAPQAEPEAPSALVPIEEIVVHGSDSDVEDTQARSTLTEEDLERAAGDDLARTIERVPGAAVAAGTTDAAKPILRGHHERRLLVLFDGVRHESQKWGPDHATEIDPFSAGEIVVIRGAAGARYGPDAIGGVVQVLPPPMRTEPGVSGKVLSTYGTNGKRPYGAARVDWAPAGVSGLSLRVEGNAGASATRRAPDYLLGNTASRTGNLGGAVAYGWSSGTVRMSWHHHAFRAGVFYGVQNSNPSDFAAQLDAERPVTADLWTSTYTIDRAYQAVQHDIGLIRVDQSGAWGSLEATYAFQLNRRREYEQVRSTVEGAQYDFLLRTHSLDAMLRHQDVSLSFGRLSGGVGLQGSFQENVYRGYALLPNYRSFGGGVFGYERLAFRRFDLEAGARADGLGRNVFMGEDDFARHQRRGTLDAEDCEEGASSSRCPSRYHTGSLSIGGVAHAIPDRLDLKLDLSSASRFPNVDELYLVGTAPSFPVYALGYPDLGVETAWGASLTALVHHDVIEAEVSTYAQRVDDYILFAPELNASGEPRFDVTIRGAWPRYAFTPTNVELHGLDGSVSLGPLAPVGVDLWGSLVRARDRADKQQLVGTPADRLTAELVWRARPKGTLRKLESRATIEGVDRQRRVDPTIDFAPAPDGYVLFGLSADVELGREHPLRLGVMARNVLDQPYREATSLLRYYADHPGRDIRVRVGTDF